MNETVYKEMIKVSLKDKKMITSNFNYMLDEMPREQKLELESLLKSLKKENDGIIQRFENNTVDNKHGIIATTDINKFKQEKESEFILYENGIFLGLQIGCSVKKDVINRMEEYSDCLIINEHIKQFSGLYFYRDVDIAYCFDNNDVVKEITFGKNFKGKTSKGLQIKDNIDKAIKMYGVPKILESSQIDFYSWGNFLIFSENKLITHMRFN